MASGIIQEMKSLLNTLPNSPRHRRSDVLDSFRSLIKTLEEKTDGFDKEIREKTENLLWFCEMITQPRFDSIEITDSHLGWPRILLDSILRKLSMS